MPRLPIDYSKNFNYKIVCKDLTITESYVGSSTNWSHRKNEHKSICNNKNSEHYHYKVYQCIRANGGWENWEMILIEYYPCKTQLESAQRERYWTETLKSNLNCNVQGRTSVEWIENNKERVNRYKMKYYQNNKEQIAINHAENYQDNKEQILAQHKIYREEHKEQKAEQDAKYYQENKEHITEYKTKWYQANKERLVKQQAKKFTCVCGCIITNGAKAHHFTSKKHQSFILANPVVKDVEPRVDVVL